MLHTIVYSRLIVVMMMVMVVVVVVVVVVMEYKPRLLIKGMNVVYGHGLI